MLIQIDILSGVQIISNTPLVPDQHFYEDDNVFITVFGSVFDSAKIQWLNVNAIQIYPDLKTAFMNRIEGAGSLIICNKKDNTIRVFTDPYRLFCLYIVQLPDKLILSDSLRQIGENVQLTVNETSIIELACINTTIGNKTIFNEVQTLPEGKVFTFCKMGNTIAIEEDVFWEFPVRRDREVALTEISEAFYAHVKKGLQLSDSISLALTAGLDSRATLAASLTGREKLQLYTHGFAKSNDVITAQRIAGYFGMHHSFYDLNTADFIRSIPDLARIVNSGYECSLNGLSHAHAVRSYTGQQQLASVFFSSFGGELLRAYYLPAGLPDAISLDAMADGIRRISQVKLKFSVFNKSENAVRDQLNQSIYDELKSAPDTSSYSALADYYYHRRNFNSVTTRFAARYFKVFNPYFSREIYDLLPSVSAHVKRSGAIQKHIVQTGDTYLSRHLLNNRYAVDNSVYSKLRVKAACMQHLARVLVNKVSNRQRQTLYFTDYDAWIKNDHRQWFLHVFEPDGNSNIFNTGELTRFAKQYVSGEQPFAYYRFLTNIFSFLNCINNFMHENIDFSGVNKKTFKSDWE